MKYYLETYGCQMNVAESAAMEATLRERAWIQGTAADADLVVINTCTVRATAENRAWGRIAQYASDKRRRAFRLMVVGCMAEQYKSDMKLSSPEIDYVLGTNRKQSFGLALDQIEAGTDYDITEESPAYSFAKTHHEPGAFRAFVPIMHGCDNFCSYCIVPYVRGREISRSPADIMAEIFELEDLGVREVTLLGQNVNSYRWEGKGVVLDFPDLLRSISTGLKQKRSAGPAPAEAVEPSGIGWVRFLTSHPKDLSPALIRVLAEDPLFCRHVHLCLQSGSDRVLAAMNRKYTSGQFLDLVASLKSAVPGLSLSTDLLVGFPGETEEDIEATLSVMKQVGFSYSFMYHFNPREGTPAARLPERVPDKVKKARLARVIELQRLLTRAALELRLGSVDEVLVESRSKKSKDEVLGRTARDEMVVFAAPPSRVGSFAKVRLIGLSGNTFKAVEVHD
ncbi:MAG: tRNA (N6-isopentenyl adenosine(37)-C2)-methylthiotransferase MiaB [Spirochaetes bacterium]|nr:tRNA (N6-isopentenyl adenosine(37)-C2)-methylthiotransferase MiaB [Spirochaetota bacterium]